ncbi:MAG: 23S rRNA (uracil(1939)-C(5))-methyltransferase RlmD, partial [Oscillospiraceae bacterium]
MLKKNDIIPMTIEGITNEGNGVCHHDGMTVFVPFTAPGDQVLVRIVKVASHHSYGIIETLETASPDRVPAQCAAFGRCGGCSLRHLDYAIELSAKNGWVSENLRRIGGLSLALAPAIGSPSIEGYRNKAVYPIRMQNGSICVGFYARRSHRIVESSGCRLHPPFFAAIVEAVRLFLCDHEITVYDEITGLGFARALFLRYGEETGEVMVCLIANGNSLPHEADFLSAVRGACDGVRSIILNVNTANTNVLLGRECHTLWGADVIRDRLCGLTFSLSPLSFYQVNRAGAERLYAIVAEFAAPLPHETLLDLYCGTGTIGLSMASHVRNLIGVEIIPEAVANARENALRNGVSNARFLCADAASAVT